MVFESGGFRLHEPDIGEASLRLMTDAFRWARSENPNQPLTTGAWTTHAAEGEDTPYSTEIDRTALSLSDVVTFHAYNDVDHVRGYIDHLSQHGRPMICTEWMARGVGSRIDDQLDLFRRSDVGCIQWGLVAGRTQTNLPWPAELVEAHGGRFDTAEWFQDLLKPDGDPYRADETATIANLMRQQQSVE